MLGETFYRRMLMLECHIAEPPAHVTSAVPVSFHRLTSTDVDAYRSFRARPGARELQRRLEEGERAFFAMNRGRMVCAVWISHGTAWIDYLKRRIPLKAGEGYLYEAYTCPDFRGQGVGPALFNFAYRTLRADGFRRILLAVNLESRAARKAFGWSGERVFAKWGYLKMGPWHLDFSRRLSHGNPAALQTLDT